MSEQLNVPFIASDEMISALKSDASLFSPVSETRLQAAIPEVTGPILDIYGAYIPDTVKDLNANINKRIVVVSQDDIEAIERQWYPESPVLDHDDLRVHGFYSEKGHLIFVTHPEEIGSHDWDRMPEEVRNNWLNIYGTPHRVKQEYGLHLFSGAAVHEIIHAYQPNHSNKYLSEGSVCYYHRELDRAHPELVYHDPNPTYALLADIYAQFVKFYGDDMHRVAFGSTMDEEKRKQILTMYEATMHIFVSALTNKS